VPPRPGDRYRVNFYRFERPARGQATFAAAAFPLQKPDFHRLEDFGHVVFVDRPVR
jgi:hypothetical protein